MLSFSLFKNDPLYNLYYHVGLANKNRRVNVFLTVIVIIIITWVIPLLLAHIQGVDFIPGLPYYSYLYDLAAYSQFLMLIPLFIFAEPYIDGEIQWGMSYIFQVNLLDKEDGADFRKKLNSASNFSQKFPVIFFLLPAFLLGFVYLIGEITNGIGNWHAFVPASYSMTHLERATWAGLWNALISQTILVYFHIRWVLKISIWYWVIWQLSRMKLRLHATHPDQFGGLGFLTKIQSRFDLLIFAEGVSVLATFCYKNYIEPAPRPITSINPFTSLTSFISLPPLPPLPPLITPLQGFAYLAFFVFAPMLFLAPLFLFTKVLVETKRRDLLEYSNLMLKCLVKLEDLLKTSDKKNLPELNISENREFTELLQYHLQVKEFYDSAQKMHTIPLDFQRTVRLFVSALGSLVPLFIQSTVFEYVRTILNSTGK